MAEYRSGFLAVIAEEATPGRHANALAHAAGYFSRELSTQFRKYGLAIDALPAPLRSRLWSWAAATAEPRP
jgi:hypothetical protein